MDADLYDEFGNYIGPDLASDEDESEEEWEKDEQPDGVEVFSLFSCMVCFKNETWHGDSED